MRTRSIPLKIRCMNMILKSTIFRKVTILYASSANFLRLSVQLNKPLTSFQSKNCSRWDFTGIKSSKSLSKISILTNQKFSNPRRWRTLKSSSRTSWSSWRTRRSQCFRSSQTSSAKISLRVWITNRFNSKTSWKSTCKSKFTSRKFGKSRRRTQASGATCPTSETSFMARATRGSIAITSSLIPSARTSEAALTPNDWNNWKSVQITQSIWNSSGSSPMRCSTRTRKNVLKPDSCSMMRDHLR